MFGEQCELDRRCIMYLWKKKCQPPMCLRYIFIVSSGVVVVAAVVAAFVVYPIVATYESIL